MLISYEIVVDVEIGKAYNISIKNGFFIPRRKANGLKIKDFQVRGHTHKEN